MMKLKLLMLFFALVILSCQQKVAADRTPIEFPASEAAFLKKLSLTEDRVKLARNEQEKALIIRELDNYVVDSVRQFKNWVFNVESVEQRLSDRIPMHIVGLTTAAIGDTSGTGVHFYFSVPKEPKEADQKEIAEAAGDLKKGDRVEMNGVIFMTDPSMQVVTLADYFDPSKPKKLFLIPVHLKPKS